MPSFSRGDEVYVTVEWMSGKIGTVRGKFLFTRGERAYVETELGVVEGDASTLEAV